MMGTIGRLKVVNDFLITVHVSNLIFVGANDHVAADTHLWGEHIVCGREGCDKGKVKRDLKFLQAASVGFDLRMDKLSNAIIIGKILFGGVFADTELRSDSSPVRNDQSDIVRPIGTTKDNLADESAHSNGLLDGRRTHIFAILELVLLLEPTSNSDPTILAHPSKVTGVEKSGLAVGGKSDNFSCGLGILVVASHDIGAVAADLTLLAR
mmetsp:Transcript_18630/g.53549  ORF Transcript_18630/g.53549 Transcript_18630/m.53549 type:complete len:210 (-) Transcript_18630:664-1293(-)